MYIDKEKVELAMARKGLTPTELARAMNRHETAPYYLLKAGRDVNPKTVGRIAKALRTVVKAAAVKENKKVVVEIIQ